MQHMTGSLGLIAMLLLAYAFSTNRRAILARTVFWGLSLQIVLALIVLRLPLGRRAMEIAGFLGLRAMLAGTMANLMSASIVGMLL